MKKTRVVVAMLIAVVVSVCAVGCASNQATTASDLAPVIPAGQLGGAFTAASVGSAERVLAADGIRTVSDEKSTSALESVSGTTRMTFTTAQVRAMALEAASHGGIPGAALDSAASMPSGDPSFSYLLASWISKTTSPAAVEVRKTMGNQDWKDAPSLTFPTIALPLFTADAIAALPPSPSDSPSSIVRGTGNPAASVTEAAFVHTSGLGTVCSTVSNFVQGVLNSVFTALQLDASSGGVGGFFKTVWNGALSLAQLAAQGLLTAITGPVLNLIKTIAGAAAVVAQVASYLKPWSVKVTADPSSVDAGSGGTVTAKVDTGTGGVDYPSAVSDCAQAAGITLPALTADKAKATWSLTAPLSTSDDTSVTLDSSGSSELSFTTSKSASGECESAASDDQSGSASITVTRPGADALKQFATTMLSNGFGIAGGIIGPVVASIVGPIFDSVLSKVDALTEVTGSATVVVTQPRSGSNCNAGGSTPQPSKSSESSAACMVGTWKLTTEQATVEGTEITGGGGATWTITAAGLVTVSFAGSQPLSTKGNPVVEYGGSETMTITVPSASATSGDWLEKSLDIQTMSLNGQSAGPGSFTNSVASKAGTWTCSGNSLTVKVDSDPIIATYSLARVS